jgi:hypothetical protein
MVIGLLQYSLHCSLCQDGGELFICNEEDCDRAVCNVCINIPAEMLQMARADDREIFFRCVSCHWGMGVRERGVNPGPYYVSI